MTNGTSRARQNEWRVRIPELTHLVENVAPAMLDSNHKERMRDVPDAWRDLVTAMRTDVHAKAENGAVGATGDDDATIEERRGYEWSWKMARVGAMLEMLIDTILADIGFTGTESIASLVLLKKAALYAQLELQDGGSKEGRDDRDEIRLRLQGALRALAPALDDVHMRRFRALQVAETCTRMTRIPSEADIAGSVEKLRAAEARIDLDHHRDFLEHEQPVLNGLLSREFLAEVDDAFQTLDPLIVLEEFADATPAGRGGKAEGGEGCTGPVRALARLAVRCGALEFSQREGETFDDAVERARSNLLVTRSRLRRAMREFPGQEPADPV